MQLILYYPNLDGAEAHSDLLRATTHTESTYQEAKSFQCFRKQDEQLEDLIERNGLSDPPNCTWELIDIIRENIRQWLEGFLNSVGETDLKRKAIAHCPLN